MFFSSSAAMLARRGIPAVLAMQYEITDKAAIECTRAFYEALASGNQVDEAVAQARTAISVAMSNSYEGKEGFLRPVCAHGKRGMHYE